MTVIAALLLAGGAALVASAQNAQDGLVAYWPLNESNGDTAADATGNGHDGTLMGDPEWTGGHFGGGLEFDGIEDEVVVPFDAVLSPETFTVTAWANVEPGSAGAHRAVLASRDDFPQRGYIFYAEPGDTWQYWTGVGGGWNVVQGPAVESGDRAHLASPFADGSQRFYYNGELAAEANAAVSINPEQDLLIGASANELDPHMFFFVGVIDDVRLYDRELSVDDIDAVMDGAITAVDAAGKLATTWGALRRN
jgi:hypothetical protein